MLVLRPVNARASSYDEDVQHFLGSDSGAIAEARDHLARGDADAMSAVVRALPGGTPEQKHWLIVLMAPESMKNIPRIKDSDLQAFAQIMRGEKDVRTRLHAMDVFRWRHSLVALRELERFGREDVDESVRDYSTFYAGESSTLELPFLRGQTHDKSRWVRLTAYAYLARTGDVSGRDLALQTLSGPATIAEQKDAVWMLGEIGNPADHEFLKKIAESPATDFRVRFDAVSAEKTNELHQLPLGGRMTFLLESLDDEDPSVREWASVQLSRSSDPLHISAIMDYLKEKGHKGYADALNALKGP